MWFWFFIVSVVTNLFMLLYVRWLLSSLAIINTDVANVSEIIRDFSSHLNQIHEMEMFYGDETLQGLLSHAADLSNDLSDLDLLLNDQEEDVKEEEDVEEEKKT